MSRAVRKKDTHLDAEPLDVEALKVSEVGAGLLACELLGPCGLCPLVHNVGLLHHLAHGAGAGKEGNLNLEVRQVHVLEVEWAAHNTGSWTINKSLPKKKGGGVDEGRAKLGKRKSDEGREKKGKG